MRNRMWYICYIITQHLLATFDKQQRMSIRQLLLG
jgi:hypothetical protein